MGANSKLIDGTVEAMSQLRSRGCKIGSTTGYTQQIMQKLRPMASKEGYTPDCYVTSDEVPVARPSPSMIFLNMIRMDIWTPKAGNYVGATEKQLAAMPKAELEAKVQAARKKLYDSGAHYVIDTVSDLPAVVDKINERLAMGLSP